MNVAGLQLERPPQVRIRGRGRKQRVLPLAPDLARTLDRLAAKARVEAKADTVALDLPLTADVVAARCRPRKPAVATVQTHSKSYLLALPAAGFQELIMTYPQFLIFVSELAEDRQRRLERRPVQLSGFFGPR